MQEPDESRFRDIDFNGEGITAYLNNLGSQMDADQDDAMADAMADSESNADFDSDRDEISQNSQTQGYYATDHADDGGSVACDSVQEAAPTPDMDNISAGSSQEPGKRTRMNGAPFVEQRPITADLDSTDELLINMKESGFRNEQISAKFAEEGRARYDKKTIGSRYLRLKAAISERGEQRLDDELTEWHNGEDEALFKAERSAEAEINDTILKAFEKRWQLVSKNLQGILKKDLKYSPGSCHKRFLALNNGAAIIPPELDDDPLERAERKAARVLAKLRERNLKIATEEEAKLQKRVIADERKLKKAIEKKDRADKRVRAAEEKAKLAKDEATKRDQKAKKLEADRQAQEDQIVMLREGRSLPAITVTKTKSAAKIVLKGLPLGFDAQSALTSSIDKSKRCSSLSTTDTPRGKMTCAELEALCSRRGLAKGGTKLILLQRISENDGTLSVEDLQTLLRGLDASTEGNKEQLIARLAQADTIGSAWGQRQVDALNKFREKTFTAPGPDSNNDPPLETRKRAVSPTHYESAGAKRIRFGESAFSPATSTTNESDIPVANMPVANMLAVDPNFLSQDDQPDAFSPATSTTNESDIPAANMPAANMLAVDPNFLSQDGQPNAFISGNQGSISGHQGFLSGPQGWTTGHQGSMSGHQGFLSGQQLSGHQGSMSGHRGFLSGHQEYMSGHQGFPSGPQGSVSGPQGFVPENQVFMTEHQRFVSQNPAQMGADDGINSALLLQPLYNDFHYTNA